MSCVCLVGRFDFKVQRFIIANFFEFCFSFFDFVLVFVLVFVFNFNGNWRLL